ncbi:tagaturonate reductase [Flavivirga spongiicola]|uniref:Tagaturonate reductase n=1 Tax=Flavivirga spongiicola TaxID=421621 RepID=A0ABU7XQM4_9FLAO|nr:tagaturonate reductase [Flavivirga sp. MEBiC05379]MDO5977880.1 tagaturonate reductase [Flavivirga sp. MEBiC05379]
MNPLNRNIANVPVYTERILQFGEGNFLRAFANWIIHEMNKHAGFDAGVVVVQPIDHGLVKMLNEQEGLYTLYLNGIKNGKVISEHQIIDCIQRGINPYENYADYLANAENPDLRFVISNTTEAGISYNASDKLDDAPQTSFPGKLTALLYKRFQIFFGASDKGLIIIPCELIDKNGDNLKRIILQYAADWNLGEAFVEWVHKDNIFCNALVDRIVPGYPRDKMDTITKELGYKDSLVVEGEQFHLWVIEGPESLKEEIPAKTCGLNVVFTNNMEPYRTRKVRILNGAHTTLVPVGYLYGIDTVRESIENDIVGAYLRNIIFNEICPTLDLSESELNQFGNDVLDRFKNPYLEHALMSISLNSTSKYKTRVLPSVLEFIKRKNNLPQGLLFSLASLILFYKGERNGEAIALKDDQTVLDFFEKQWATESIEDIVKNTLSNTNFWEIDLTRFEGFQNAVTNHLQTIVSKGMKAALVNLEKNQ